MRTRSLAALACCGSLFGLSYVLVRLVAPVLGPVGVTVGRTLIGGTALFLLARARRQSLRGPGWLAYLLLGALSAAIPFSLISVATLRLGAGTSAVLNASAPMFALLIDSVRRRRRPRPAQLVGLALASAGVLTVMSARGPRPATSDLAGIAAGLTGAAVFAYAGFFAADRFGKVPPLAVAAGQQLAGCALLLAVLPVVPPTARIRAADLGVLAVLGLLGSALAYLLFYWLIGREGPAWAANVNLLVPVFGVGWGWVLLAEPIPPVSLAGILITVAGLALVLRPQPATA
jgi:drug/metabolite transporter (DMT)-like permease